MEFANASGLVDGPIRESKVQSRDVLQQIPLAEFGAVRYVIASAKLVKYVLPPPKPNPYLRRPAELQQAGFSGTPYHHPA